MTVVIIALIAFVAGALIVAYILRRELRRMARFLVKREPRSNARLTCGIPDKTAVMLARSVNVQLDKVQSERLEREADQREYKHQLTSFSHDVRTPLMGAKGYLQLALDEPDRAIRTRYLETAQSRIDSVHELLDQLFEYTQTEDPETKYNLEQIQIMPLVANGLYGSYPVFEERGWEPIVDFEDEGFSALCDKVAMDRIIENLVSNDLRYGLSAPVVTQRGRVVRFANKVDDSQSIDVSRLFDSFYQVDEARSGKGAGLGLAVVANLAHAMGMQVDASVEDDELRIDLGFPD